MRAPEEGYVVDPMRLGGFAVAGILALALSLAGVMGGHQLLGAVFGHEDPEGALSAPAAGGADCPAALQAADACDYDDGGTPQAGEADSCAGPHEAPAAAAARGGR